MTAKPDAGEYDVWKCRHGDHHARPIAVAICGCERPCLICHGTLRVMARVQRITPAGRVCTDELVACPDCVP